MKSSLESCIRTAQKGDPIILIEDAVLAVTDGGTAADTLKAAMGDHDIYAMSADIKARGVDKVVDGIKVTDYAGMVELVEQHRTMTWL